MKTKLFFSIVLFIASLLLGYDIFSQENKSKELVGLGFEKKKNALSNVKLTIELNGKTAYCTTNENGEFFISLSEPTKIFNDASVVTAVVTVQQPTNSKMKVLDTKFSIKLKKDNAPLYKFILYYEPVGTKDEEMKVKVECEEVSNITVKANSQGIKREKGDASKVGDKYIGDVAHF